MQFPYKNNIDKFLVEICRFTGADDRICAFSGAPRSAIINCRLCRQVYHYPTAVRQSVLLPQNGSHPQILSKIQSSNQKESTQQGTLILVRMTGFEPARSPTGT